MLGWLRVLLCFGLSLYGTRGFTDSPKPDPREALVEVINTARQSVPTAQFISSIELAFSDEDLELHRFAIACVRSWNEKYPRDLRPTQALLTALRTEHDATILIEAVRLLGLYKEPQAVEPLLVLFRKREPFWTINGAPRADVASDVFDIASNGLIDAVSRAVALIGDPMAIPVLKKRWPERRASVVNALAALNDSSCLPLLLEALPSSFPQTESDRVHAVAVAQALEHLADASCAERLCQALLDAEKFHNVGLTLMESYRRSLINSVAQTYDSRAVDTLLSLNLQDALAQGRVEHVPSSIARMGIIAVPHLLKAIQSNEAMDSQRRQIAILAVEHMTPILQPHDWKQLGPVLAQAIGNSDATTVRQVLKTLERLSQWNVMSLRDLRDLRPELLLALRTWKQNEEILAGCLRLVTLLRDPAFADSAAQMLKHPSYRVHGEAVSAVIYSRHPQGTALVVPLLASEQEGLRSLAAQALAAGDRSVAVQPLIQVLKNGTSSKSACHIVSRTLALLGDPRAGDAIIEHSLKADPRLPDRSALIVFAAWLGNERGLAAMKELLEGDLDFQRVDVCQHLADLSRTSSHLERQHTMPPEVGDWLRKSVTELFQRESPPAYVDQCLSGLVCIPDDATRRLLTQLATSRHSQVSRSAIRALLASSPETHVNVIMPGLREQDPPFVRQLAVGLRVVSNPQVMAGLIDVVKSSTSMEVRDAALGSLGELHVTEARELMESLSKTDSHPYIRARATLELEKLR